MTSFFRRTLFFVLLFGGVCNVWGTEYSLSFIYTQVGSEDPSTNICSYYDKDKIILDSDFGWNKGKDDVCNRSNGGEIDGWMMCKNAAKACSRSTYSFDATTVTVTLKVKCKDNGTYTGPTVKIKDTYSCSFGSITFNNGYEEKTLNNSITVTQAGTYDISVEFAGSDKFYVQDIKLSFTASPTVTYSVTYDANSATSGSVPTDNTAYTSGQTVTVKGNTGSLVRTNYEFAGWNTNAEGTGTTYSAVAPLGTFEISDNTTLYAKWKATVVQYDVKYYDGSTELGTETVASGDTPKNYGNYQTKANHDFVNWYNESNWQSVANFSTAITANKDFYGKWTEKAKYQITVSAGANGSVSKSPEPVEATDKYYEGTEVTITATPYDGYAFDQWQDGNKDNPRTITVTAAATYTASFKKDTKICTNTKTIECETYSDYPEPTKGTKHPSGIQFANDYYKGFTGTGYVDFKGISGEIYFPIHLPASNYTFTFAIRNGGNRHFNLYQKTNGSGDITLDGINYSKINDGEKLNNAEWSGSQGDAFVSEDKSRNSVADDDYVIGLYGEGYAAFDHIIITASSNVFCESANEVTFSATTGGTATATAGGTNLVSPAPVKPGTSVTFTAAADDDYDFMGWYSGGALVSNNTSYVRIINEDVTLEARFQTATTKRTLSASVADGQSSFGSVDKASQSIGEGSAATVIATAASHYGFTHWTATGISLTPEQQRSETLSITMPTNDVSVVAHFEYVYVDAVIVSGISNNVTKDNGSATYTWSHPDNNVIGHKVLQIDYSNMSGNYGNNIITVDASYQSSASAGATGFGLYYMTESTSIAFVLDYGGDGQKKTQLPGTGGVWKYVYVQTNSANGWNGSTFTIWMNGQDNNAATGNWTPSSLPQSGQTTYTNPSSGTLYIADICATEITTKPDLEPCGTCFPVNFGTQP